MVKKSKVTPYLTEKTIRWLENNFDTPTGGAGYALESYPELYARTLQDLRRVFTSSELSLILDVQNGCLLTPQFAGQHLIGNVKDGITLAHMESKWKINGEALVKKLCELKIYEIAMLEIWASAFWCQAGDSDIEKWVSGLAK